MALAVGLVPGTESVEAYSRRAERFLAGLEGPTFSGWLSNVHARVGRWRCGDLLLPLVETEGRGGDAGICSIRTHYVDYARAVATQTSPAGLSRAVAAGLQVMGVVIDRLRLGNAVLVGHWLLPSNPVPPLDAHRIDQFTAELCRRHPDRSLIIRSLNRTTGSELLKELKARGYVLVRSRLIWMFDPSDRQVQRSRDTRRDLRLLEASPWIMDKARWLSPEDAERIHELYDRIYLEKYSALNPSYTPAFLRHLMEQEILEFRVLRREGRIDAFICWFEQDRNMTGAILGYDSGRPLDDGLFRQVMAVELGHALSAGKVLNLGAGNGRFKACRGAYPELEFDAVYCEHQPAAVRAAWRGMALLLNLAERIMGRWWRSRPHPQRLHGSPPATGQTSPTGSRPRRDPL